MQPGKDRKEEEIDDELSLSIVEEAEKAVLALSFNVETTEIQGARGLGRRGTGEEEEEEDAVDEISLLMDDNVSKSLPKSIFQRAYC